MSSNLKFHSSVLFLKLCRLKALICCFNGERSKEDNGLKGIKWGRKEEKGWKIQMWKKLFCMEFHWAFSLVGITSLNSYLHGVGCWLKFRNLSHFIWTQLHLWMIQNYGITALLYLITVLCLVLLFIVYFFQMKG